VPPPSPPYGNKLSEVAPVESTFIYVDRVARCVYYANSIHLYRLGKGGKGRGDLAVPAGGAGGGGGGEPYLFTFNHDHG
jgi:hypothetical protein